MSGYRISRGISVAALAALALCGCDNHLWGSFGARSASDEGAGDAVFAALAAAASPASLPAPDVAGTDSGRVASVAGCTPGVRTTISADFRRANQGQYGDAGSHAAGADGAASASGAGSGNGGADGGGDAGAGDGRFRNALIAVRVAPSPGVERSIGEAAIDADFGLVSFALCAWRGVPVRFTVKARSDNTSEYFDESVGAYRPFHPGEEMNAVISAWQQRNVGITVLTEAAYLRMTDNGAAPLGWTHPERVTEANERVRIAINRVLPGAMQVADITRLPWLVGNHDETPAGSIADSENGRYGVVIAGLGRQSSLFRGLTEPGVASGTGTTAADDRPSRTLTRQLAADLSDGRLNLIAKEGRPVLHDGAVTSEPLTTIAERAAQATYTPAQFAEMTNTGVSRMSTDRGSDGVVGKTLRINQVRLVIPIEVQSPDDLLPPVDEIAIFALGHDGRLFFSARRAPDRPPVHEVGKNFRQLYPSGAALGSTEDGQVWTLPDVVLRMAGSQLGPRNIVAGLKPSPYFRNSTKLIGWQGGRGSGGILARLADGSFFTSDDITLSGPGVPRSIGSTGRQPVPYSRVETTVPPVSVFLRHGALDIAASIPLPGPATYLVLLADFRVYGWGNNATGQLGLGHASNLETEPVALPFPRDTKLIAIAGHRRGGYAIDARGAVHGWGDRVLAGRSTTTPQPFDELNRYGPMIQIACADFQWPHCVAITEAGKAVIWGELPRSGPPLHAIDTAPQRAILPPERRLIFAGSAGATLYGMLDDGTLLWFGRDPELPQRVGNIEQFLMPDRGPAR